MAPKRSKPSSKRPVTCGQCSKVLERRESLKPHFDKFHEGRPPFEKGQTQLNIGSSSTSAKRTVAENENLSSSPRRSDEQSNSDSHDGAHHPSATRTFVAFSPPGSPPLFCPSTTLTTHAATVGTDVDVSSDVASDNNLSLIRKMKEMLGQLEINVCQPQPSSSRGKASSSEMITLNAPVSLLSDAMSISETSPLSSPPMSPKPTMQRTEQSTSSEDKLSEQLNLLSQCSCLKHIVNLMDDVFELNLEYTLLKCIFCHHNDGAMKVGFDVSNVEYEKLAARSQNFRNLTKLLKKHIQLDSHKKNINTESAVDRKRDERNRNMGLRIGTFAYYIFYNDLPFRFFQSFMPWFTLNDIDMGEINHSKEFIKLLVTPVYNVLLKRLQVLLEEPLPCTGKPSPFAIMGDKGTIKRDVTQPTLIRIVSLRKNNLFGKYYMSHPEVTSHKGKEVTELLLSSLKDVLGWSIGKIRQRFCGGSFDGQYIKLNVPEHMADKLSLEKEFTKESITWDIAHRVELACDNAKEQTAWLKELDTTLQSTMKKFTMGKHHTDLERVASESGERFLEFCLFSETRFMEYSHRTYDHFYKMYHILIRKIQKDFESDDSDLVLDREHTEKLLAQASFILGLVFNREISHLMTRFSKCSQKFDVLPFYGMNLYGKLIQKLVKARNELKSGKSPEVEPLDPAGSHKSFQLWDDFKTCTETLLNDQTFREFKVLLPSERGRVRRSGSNFACDQGSYLGIVKTYFGKFANYIDALTFHLGCRLVPWPQWVKLSDDCFNFRSDTTDEQRKFSLDNLMQEKSGPVPLTNDEKIIIRAEYITLLVHVKELRETTKFGTAEEFWYTLLTEQKYFESCRNLNEFALRFLTRTFNECSVEAQVSAINSIETSSRPLDHKTVEKLTFISSNGPHPLFALNVIEDALNLHFKGKRWHFVISNCKYFTSKVVDRLFREAEAMPNELA